MTKLSTGRWIQERIPCENCAKNDVCCRQFEIIVGDEEQPGYWHRCGECGMDRVIKYNDPKPEPPLMKCPIKTGVRKAECGGCQFQEQRRRQR